MSLNQYTSYADIRAVLGVPEEELEDSTLSLPVYQFGLGAELSAIGASLASDYTGLPSSGLTEVQATFQRATYMFATYAVAKQLLGALPLFAPKEVGDGKSHVTRYAQDPYKVTITAVGEGYETWKGRLREAYAAVKSTSTSTRIGRSYLINVGRGTTDPVTGA